MAKIFGDDFEYIDIDTAERNTQFSFSFIFIPLSVVEEHIKKIDICKSSGIPTLSSLLIKDAFKVLSVELTHNYYERITKNM